MLTVSISVLRALVLDVLATTPMPSSALASASSTETSALLLRCAGASPEAQQEIGATRGARSGALPAAHTRGAVNTHRATAYETCDHVAWELQLCQK
jgi:hypothetical protein